MQTEEKQKGKKNVSGPSGWIKEKLEKGLYPSKENLEEYYIAQNHTRDEVDRKSTRLNSSHT